MAFSYFQVETRPGLHLPVVELSRIRGGNGKTAVLIADDEEGRRAFAGSPSHPRRAALFRALLKAGYRILSLDLVGTGELARHVHSPGWESIDPFYPRSFFANGEALYQGTNHIGSAATDLMKVLRAFAPDTGAGGGAALICFGGYASFVGGLAAAFTPEVRSLLIDDYLPDLADLPERRDFRGDYLLYHQGFHGITDMPYLLGVAAPKPIFLGVARDAESVPDPASIVEQAAAWTRTVYARIGAGSAFGVFGDRQWDAGSYADSALAWMETRDLRNDPPRLEAAERNHSAAAMQPFNLPLEPQDPEGEDVRIGIEQIPSWLEWDPSTRVLSGTPKWGDIGTYTLAIRLEDVHGRRAELNLTIIVSAPSDTAGGLRFVSIPDTAITVGSTYRYAPEVVDAGCDACPGTFRFSLVNAPGWINVDASSGFVQGVTSEAAIGWHDIVLAVTNVNRLTAYQHFRLAVHTQEPGLEVRAAPPDTAFVGLSFATRLLGASPAPNLGGIRFALLRAPQWLRMDSAGILTGVPDSADRGLDTALVAIGGPDGAKEHWLLPIQVGFANEHLLPLRPTDGAELPTTAQDIRFEWERLPASTVQDYVLRMWGGGGDTTIPGLRDTSLLLPRAALLRLIGHGNRLLWTVGAQGRGVIHAARDTFALSWLPVTLQKPPGPISVRLLALATGGAKGALLVVSPVPLILTLDQTDLRGRRLAPTVRLVVPAGRTHAPLPEGPGTGQRVVRVTGRTSPEAHPFFYFTQSFRLPK